MTIERSTISLLGFLATTALGIGVTFAHKKTGIGIALVGGIGSVVNLMYNLCFRKTNPVTPLGKDWVKTTGSTAALDDDDEAHELLLDSDEDDYLRKSSASPDETTAAVTYKPGVLERFGSAISNMLSRSTEQKYKVI